MSEEHHLTINDFRFSKIIKYTKIPPSSDKEQLLVKVVKTDPVYKHLSSEFHRSYIQHNIPEIPNSAPTLEQFWEELLVYRCDTQDDPTTPIQLRKPKSDFFEGANLNFASSKNVRHHKHENHRLIPLYYYHYNTKTNSPEFLGMKEAKKLFCKEYEKDIMENEDGKSTFLLLLTLCKNRNKEFPVIIRGFGNEDNMYEPTDLKAIYEDPKRKFTCEYCLVEMLIHYPNLNECLWNK